jgi:hypothetical protein
MSTLGGTSIGIGTISPSYSIDNKVSNGLCRLTSSSNVIYGMQFGKSIGAAGTTTVTFPNTFPSDTVYVTLTPFNAGQDSNHMYVPTIGTVTKSSFTWIPYVITFGSSTPVTSNNGSYTINWTATCYYASS